MVSLGPKSDLGVSQLKSRAWEPAAQADEFWSVVHSATFTGPRLPHRALLLRCFSSVSAQNASPGFVLASHQSH